jgi:hypothetical protein
MQWFTPLYSKDTFVSFAARISDYLPCTRAWFAFVFSWYWDNLASHIAVHLIKCLHVSCQT